MRRGCALLAVAPLALFSVLWAWALSPVVPWWAWFVAVGLLLLPRFLRRGVAMPAGARGGVDE